MSIRQRAAAQLQRAVDDAAQHAHDRLAADPTMVRPGGRGQAATAFALTVIALGLLALAGLVWATTHASGFVSWGLIAVGWMLVLAAIPRPWRLPKAVQVLDPAAYPAIHRLVSQIAAAVGATTPTIVGVDLGFNAYVGPVGWRGNAAMVIGMPLWRVQSWDMRLGTLGHELGHLAGRDALDRRIIDAGHRILASWVGVCFDVDRADPWRDLLNPSSGVSEGFERRAAAALLRIVGVVPLMALLVLQRLSAESSQLREYLADRRAALATGSVGLAAALSVDVRGCHTIASAAVRRGEDPFAVLDARSAQPPANPAIMPRQADERHTWDATHPPLALRVDLLQRLAALGAFRPDPETLAAAARELDVVCARSQKEFRDLLIDSWAQ